MNAALAIRDARADDLARIVAIYNEAIPGRRATADTEPVSVESRRAWFLDHTPGRRPLWVLERDGAVVGWLSLQDFYGRPAYAATAEISVYVSPAAQGGGIGRRLVLHALERTPALGLSTLVGFVYDPEGLLRDAQALAAWARPEDDLVVRCVVG